MSNLSTAHAHERRAHALHRAHAAVTAVAIQPSPADTSGDMPRGLVVGHQMTEVLKRTLQVPPDGVSWTPLFSRGCYRVLLLPPDDHANVPGVGLA